MVVMKKTYGGLDNVVGADGAPLDVSGIPFTEDGDGLSCDPKLAVLGLDGALEAAVDRVVLEHVDLAKRKNQDPEK
jgi:phage-related protein